MLLGFVVTREVRADRGPAHAAVGRLETAFAAQIQHAGIIRRNFHWSSPLEAVLHIGGLVCARAEPWSNILHLPRVSVITREVPIVVAGKNNFRVARIGPDVAGFPAANRVPIAFRDRTRIGAAGGGS